jgi:biopolymer transport protein ExbD
MKFGKASSGPVRIRIPIAPLISVAFLLLMFFMLNLKIIAAGGSYYRNMPITAPTGSTAHHHAHDIKVSLKSDQEGNLTQLAIGSKNLGNDEFAFELLNKEILAIIGRPGNPLTKEIEVEIDADFETQYKYVVKAISKCTGGIDPDTRQVARYVEKIKFAPPHAPKTF